MSLFVHQSFDCSESTSIHILIMPQTVVPWVLFALSALDILADLVRTFSTAIWTDHFATTNLIPLRALKESGSLLTIWKKESNLEESLFCNSEGVWVVPVDRESKCGSSVSAAGTTTDSAALIEASGTLEVARVPASAGDWVTRIWLSWVVIVAVIVGDGAQVAFLCGH